MRLALHPLQLQKAILQKWIWENTQGAFSAEPQGDRLKWRRFLKGNRTRNPILSAAPRWGFTQCCPLPQYPMLAPTSLQDEGLGRLHVGAVCSPRCVLKQSWTARTEQDSFNRCAHLCHWVHPDPVPPARGNSPGHAFGTAFYLLGAILCNPDGEERNKRTTGIPSQCYGEYYIPSYK